MNVILPLVTLKKISKSTMVLISLVALMVRLGLSAHIANKTSSWIPGNDYT